MSRGWVASAVVAWLAAISIGVAVASLHETTAGARGEPARSWPSDTQLLREMGRATIVMFAHPRCPCTRASLGELARIMADARTDAVAIVAFLRPDDETDAWEQTDAWTAAGAIPRTTRFVDHGGMEAKRFGALTSGHVVVYDTSGALVFSGGITGSRGHAGANVGARAVLAHVTHEPTTERDHDVFGCALESP